MNSSRYTKAYFDSSLFDQDYEAVAAAIMTAYHPKTVLDVGCGPGKLSQALAKRGAKVVAIDGYASPDFTGYTVTFHRCDLNSSASLGKIEVEHPTPFDLAVCLEVAEHLEPPASDTLVKFLCKNAAVVVFSAAVPGQGGEGHINCQPRQVWHERFITQGFCLNHIVRPHLTEKPDVPAWYRYNILDYIDGRHSDHGTASESRIVRSLITTESSLASEYYGLCEIQSGLNAKLSYFPVRLYLSSRRFAKTLLTVIKRALLRG
jgi:SAM-dependent methyltransferase